MFKNEGLVYSANMKNNMWAKCGFKYHANWKITVQKNAEIIFTAGNNLDGKNVLISIESSSLGDNIAWFPYAEEFRLKHKCNLTLSTFYNFLFESEYPEIKFVQPGAKAPNIFAHYKLGVFNLDNGKFDASIHRKDHKYITLQQIASDILGLDFKEIKPRLRSFPPQKKREKKYVCIATQSTSQCKYWNNPNGWIETIDYLKNLGYDVICIDKYSSFGGKGKINNIPPNCINKTGDLPLESRINDILGCEFFIGLGSGLSWLAWACNKPVVLVSGFSHPKSEFKTPYRVHNNKVCNSCWIDPGFPFDPNNWLWCPRNKDFECSKEISFEMVKEKIDQCIKELKIIK
jgi:autotransporter strand-loop-strand O-heptosyltransferase